jgi:flagellin
MREVRDPEGNRTMSSVNTNFSALAAIQTLNQTNRDLNEVQARINSGLKVNSAKDDAAVFAIATAQRARLGGLTSLQAGIDRASNLLDVTQTAGQQVADILTKMKEKAQAVAAGGLSTAQMTSYSEEYAQLRSSIDNIVNSATFNGVTLVGTGAAAQTVSLNDASTAATMTLVAGLGPAQATIATATNATTAMGQIDTSLTTLNSALGTFGAQSKALDAQKTFLSKLADTVEKGIGQMVDADLSRESARLQSLQVKQQLGIQALSIANQGPSAVLGLFR